MKDPNTIEDIGQQITWQETVEETGMRYTAQMWGERGCGNLADLWLYLPWPEATITVSGETADLGVDMILHLFTLALTL